MCERSKSQQAPVYTDSMLDQMRRFKPPPPPGDSDSWELQFCRWWGWNWVKKRDENDYSPGVAATPSPRRLPRPCDESRVRKKHFAQLYNCLLFKKKSSQPCPYRNLYRTPSNSDSHINHCGYLKEDETNTPERVPSYMERVPKKGSERVPPRSERRKVKTREKCMQTAGSCINLEGCTNRKDRTNPGNRTNGVVQTSASASSELCKQKDLCEEGTLTCTSTEGSVEYVTIQHQHACACTSNGTEKMDKPIQNVATYNDSNVQVEYAQPLSNSMPEPKKSSKVMQTSVNNSDYKVQMGGEYCDCHKRYSSCPCRMNENEMKKLTRVGKTQTAPNYKEKKRRKMKIYCCHGCACPSGCVSELHEGDEGNTTKFEDNDKCVGLVHTVQRTAGTKWKVEKPMDSYNSVEPLHIDDKKTFPSVGHISELKSTLSDLTDYNRKLDEVSRLLSSGSEEFRRSMENLLDISDIEYQTQDIDYLDFLPSAASRLMLDVMCDTIMDTETSLQDKTTGMDDTFKMEEVLDVEGIHFNTERNRNDSSFNVLQTFQTNRIVLDKPDISITNIDFFLDFMLKPKDDGMLLDKRACRASPSVPIVEREEIPDELVKCQEIQTVNNAENLDKSDEDKGETKQKKRKKTMLPVRKIVKK